MGMVARVKSWLSGEGSWRGLFSGMGENAGWYPLGRIEDGYQRNLGGMGGNINIDAYACATHYATALAGVGLQHVRRLDNSGMEVVTTSPAARFARYPNDYQVESDFILTYVMRLMLDGNAVAYAMRDERLAINAVHMVPYTRYVTDPVTGAIFYDISGNQLTPIPEIENAHLVPARFVAHTRLYCPRHPLEGVSPIQNAAVSAGLGNIIRESAGAFTENMNRPSGVIETDLQLKKDQAEQLRAMWDEQSKAWSLGKTPILTNGMKWHSASMSAIDADVVNTLKMTSLDIARVYGMPPALLGIEGSSTVANTEALINQWRAQGLNFVAQHVEVVLGRLFGLPANEEFRFDLDNLARSDFQSKVSSLTTGIQQGLFSPNEARKTVNLPAVKHGDEPRVQAQVVPLSQVEMMNSAPAPKAPVEKPVDEEVARAYVQQVIEKAMS